MNYSQSHKADWTPRLRKEMRPYPGTFEHDVYVARRLIGTVLALIKLEASKDIVESSQHTLTNFCKGVFT